MENQYKREMIPLPRMKFGDIHKREMIPLPRMKFGVASDPSR